MQRGQPAELLSGRATGAVRRPSGALADVLGISHVAIAAKRGQEAASPSSPRPTAGPRPPGVLECRDSLQTPEASPAGCSPPTTCTTCTLDRNSTRLNSSH